MRKKVLKAFLHDGNVHLPILGNVGGEIPSKSKTIPGLVLETEGNYLYVTAPGASILVPLQNVKVMIVEPEAPSKSSK